MLRINSISKTFNPGTITEKRALTDVSLKLAEGDFVTVIGGNGAGKSTMLNAVAGVFPVDSGTIEIGGVDVTKLPEYKRAAFLGRVFQDPMTDRIPAKTGTKQKYTATVATGLYARSTVQIVRHR